MTSKPERTTANQTSSFLMSNCAKKVGSAASLIKNQITLDNR